MLPDRPDDRTKKQGKVGTFSSVDTVAAFAFMCDPPLPGRPRVVCDAPIVRCGCSRVRLRNQPDVSRAFPHPRCGSIRGAVIHDDDLIGKALPLQDGAQSAQNERFRIVRWNKDRNINRFARAPSAYSTKESPVPPSCFLDADNPANSRWSRRLSSVVMDNHQAPTQ